MAPSARTRRSTIIEQNSYSGIADIQFSDVRSAMRGSSRSNFLQSASLAGLSSLLHRSRRRMLLRFLGLASSLFLIVWLLLLFLGVFDPNLRLGGHIDSRTFQLLPNGDPRKRKEALYIKPPNYFDFVAEWKRPSFDLFTNSPPSKRTCDKSGPLMLYA